MKNKYDIFVNPTGGSLADISLRVAHIGQTDIADNEMLTHTLLVNFICDIHLNVCEFSI